LGLGGGGDDDGSL